VSDHGGPLSLVIVVEALVQPAQQDGEPVREAVVIQVAVAGLLARACDELSRVERYGHPRRPPATRMLVPEIHSAASEARKTAAAPMSDGWPRRPSGVAATVSAS
jgi:hypothetical protein